MYIKSVATLACALMLSSCQFGIDVVVSGTSLAPLFTLGERGKFGGVEPPLFDALEVYENSTKGWPAVWAVSRQGEGCKPAANSIVYGRTPSNFIVSVDPHPLREGVTYEVLVSGCGRTGGTLFKIVHGQVETVSQDGR